MRCKKCGKELVDFNEFSKDDSRRKEIGIAYRKEDGGMVFFCNNESCKKYRKMLVKGFDFGKRPLWFIVWRKWDALRDLFLHTFAKLSTKGK